MTLIVRSPEPPAAAVLPPPAVRLPAVRRPNQWDVTKRWFDAVLAAVLLVLLAPLLLLVACGLRIDSRGPAIFRQKRYGRHGEVFTVLKFRTMRTDTSPALHQQYIAALASGEADDQDGLKKLTRDPRVTRVGGFLRKTSIDELPQLLNVARGEMSLVGPRPALEYELPFYDEHHFERFTVRPGLTGLWQVEGRSTLGFREMLDLDVSYARRTGPRLDAAILLRTPRALVGGRAA